jgi:hypothetical protein
MHRAHKAISYFNNEFQVELQKLEAERQQEIQNMKNAILGFRNDILESEAQVNDAINSQLTKQEVKAKKEIKHLKDSKK